MYNHIKKECDLSAEARIDKLWELSLRIHDHPEIAFHEHFAKEQQLSYLKAEGFEINSDIKDLPTAYIAKFGHGAPHIAIISEYDALPSLGHGCGHNLICASAVGTVAVLKEVLEKHDMEGTIFIYGTPAEESGGGKIIMLKNHYFDSLDAVLFMHPTSDLTRLAGACMSSKHITITYHGKAAHAGSHPDNGINALSAANLFCVAAGFMRQHFKRDVRFSCIMKEGGAETGLIPDTASLECSLSCFNLKVLESMARKMEECAKGCGSALGCTVEVFVEDGYQGRIPNKTLSDICRKELEDMGEPLLDGMPFDYGGEDLGNVSRIIPICNPYVTIFPDHKISNHTEQFKQLACSPSGRRCILVTMKCLSRTAIDLLEKPEIISDAKKELAQRLEKE